MQVNRRLYRCRHDQRLTGLAAGVAEYFDLDPTLVRVLWFLSIFLGGIGLLLYIGLAIIVPLEPATAVVGPDGTPLPDDADPNEPEGHRHAPRGNGRGTLFVGLVLMLFGGLALLNSLLPSWSNAEQYLVPAFIIGIGALLVAGAVRREPMGS
jgi:phage shock protein C